MRSVGGGIERERGVDSRHEPAREPASLVRERRRAGLDRLRDLLDRHAPERMPVASVSQSSTPTDQTSLCGVASPPSSRSGAM